MAKLTPDQINVSHAWLNDVFFWGELTKDSKRPSSMTVNYYLMYGRRQDSAGKAAAKNICDLIKFRSVDYQKFMATDEALITLSDRAFIPNLHSTYAYDRQVSKHPNMLAKYIANFCAENKLYFDTSNNTSYEMDAITKTTIGAALWDYMCFTSQEPAIRTSRTTGSGSSGVPGQPPQNNYKQSGPQSGNVRALIGQPNQKVLIGGLWSFRIEGTNANSAKVPATVHVKPLSKKGDANGVNKIFIGSANGYTDCACYWDGLHSAQNFLQKCLPICPAM